MEIMRHVAKLANTDQRCVVAFMQIPNREDHALIIPVDNLPPRVEQAVMDVLRSPEGQNEENFAVALSRRLLPDTGQNIFETLHTSGRLVPVPVNQVLMMPRPNQPVKLSSILEQLGRLANGQTDAMMEDYAVNKFNPHLNNQQANTAEANRNIARNLLVGAEMLEADAKRKREEAYRYDPSLRGTSVPSSDPTPDLFGDLHTAAASPSVPPPDVTVGDPAVPATPDLAEMLSKLMMRMEEQDKRLDELWSANHAEETDKRRAKRSSTQKNGAQD